MDRCVPPWQKGFTLVELAIVLVAAAMLKGGILVGTFMRNAELQASCRLREALI